MLAAPSLGKGSIKVPNLKPLRLLFAPFASASKMIYLFLKSKCTVLKVRFFIGPSDIQFAGVYVCTFQPANIQFAGVYVCTFQPAKIHSAGVYVCAFQPANIHSAGVYVCTFQPENCTGQGSGGVKEGVEDQADGQKGEVKGLRKVLRTRLMDRKGK